MTGDELRALLGRVLPRLAEARDELRDLDAAIGDGDLGITVAEGCAAAVRALDELPDDSNPGQVLRAAGPAVARANPSTFAALIAGSLLAAARELADTKDLGLSEALLVGHSAADAIATRGKSGLGDKTLLDALIPSIAAAEAYPQEALTAALAAARAGLESTRDMTSKKGRAAWVGERTRGHLDAGATAYVRFLEALATEMSAPSVDDVNEDGEKA